MKLFLKMNYPDLKDEFGQFVNGDKYKEIKNIEELYNSLKQINDEDLLNHVHLEFVKEENTNIPCGEVTILLKDSPGFHTITYLY